MEKVTKNGFVLTLGNKQLFYVTDKNNVTKNVLHTFIDKIGEIKNLCIDLIERCKTDEPTLKDLKYRIQSATIELKEIKTIKYYSIVGKNFTESIPEKEAEKCLVIF